MVQDLQQISAIDELRELEMMLQEQ